MAEKFDGIVIKSTGSWYSVLAPSTGEVVRCRLRGQFRLKESRATNPVAVGDHVTVESCGPAHEDAAIVEIATRRNYLIRRASNLSKESHIIAANIDQVYVIATIDHPPTSPEFIDRVLVTAQAYDIPATILVNKTDLLQSREKLEALDALSSIYTGAGYPVEHISAVTGKGVDALRAEMRDKVSLLTGNSGVGKSTLINALDPSLSARVGEISEYHNRGRHTTTFSEIFPLTGGGLLIDTPGIKGFGLIDIGNEELYRYFPELMKYSEDCQFYNCTHVHEPGCAVVEAVGQGKISLPRYESYLKMLDDDDKYRK